ncbi:MAG: hypothetical protein Q9170_005166 [Blastenia crenularia]
MNDLISQIQTEITARRDWIGIPSASQQASHNVRLLDYACGAGEISRTLLQFVDEVKGVDVAGVMVKAFNDQASAAGIPAGKIHAVQGDILAPAKNEQAGIAFGDKEWFEFDFVVLSMALHHVPQPDDAVKKLVDRLKEGGTLVIVDWELHSVVFHKSGDPKPSSGDSKHHHGHGHGQGESSGHTHNVVPGSEETITRSGFGKEEVEKMFADAGCGDLGFEEFQEKTRLGDGEKAVMQKLFIAKGKKRGTKM